MKWDAISKNMGAKGLNVMMRVVAQSNIFTDYNMVQCHQQWYLTSSLKMILYLWESRVGSMLEPWGPFLSCLWWWLFGGKGPFYVPRPSYWGRFPSIVILGTCDSLLSSLSIRQVVFVLVAHSCNFFGFVVFGDVAQAE
jgi:hypothetical protein